MVTHYDNSQIDNCKTLDELAYLASMEKAGDLVLMIRKFARSASLTANTEEDIWVEGGTKTFLSAASTLSVVSASTADDLGGTGANYLQLSGVDSDYNILNELVEMNGTTPVVTTNSFLRINRARVVSSGTGQTNAGNITVTAVTGGSTQAIVVAGDSITYQSFFTVPAGYTAFTRNLVMSVYRAAGGSGAKAAEVTQMAYTPSTNTIYRTIKYGVRNDGGVASLRPSLANQSPEKTTLWLKAIPESTGTVVTTSQEIILVKGNYDRTTLL